MALSTLPILALLAQAPLAEALPRTGAASPRARLEDPDGRVLDLRFPGAKPTLILYEDRDSAGQNLPLKNDLLRVARQNAAASKAVVFAGVADVSDYDFWPVRGFAAQAVRKKSKETGRPIYCDWDGAFRRAYGLRRGFSTVVLVGRDGRVRFAAEGPLGPEARARLFELLASEVGKAAERANPAR
jgi:hypothetical protein